MGLLSKQRTIFQILIVLVGGVSCLALSAPNQGPAYSVADRIQIDDNVSEFFSVVSLDWSPDDKRIAIGGHVATYIYTVDTRQIQLLRDEPGTSNRVAWDAEGTRLAGSARHLWVWDVETDGMLTSSNNPGRYNYFDSVIWGPDENVIASTYTDGFSKATIQFWDISTNTLSDFSVDVMNNPLIVGWSPDKSLLAITPADRSMITIVKYENGEIVQILSDDLTGTPPVAWSSDGSLLASGSTDGHLIIWDTTTWETLTVLPGHEARLRALRWNPSNTHIASAAEDGIRIWNVNTGSFSIVQNVYGGSVDWNSNGKQLVTAIDNELYIWDINSLP